MFYLSVYCFLTVPDQSIAFSRNKRACSRAFRPQVPATTEPLKFQPSVHPAFTD
jgi:hypothetical protein